MSDALIGKRWRDDGIIWVVRKVERITHEGWTYECALYHHDVNKNINDEDVNEECEWSKVAEVKEWLRRHAAPALTGDFAPSLEAPFAELKRHPAAKAAPFKEFWTKLAETFEDEHALALSGRSVLESTAPEINILMGQVMDALSRLGLYLNIALIPTTSASPCARATSSSRSWPRRRPWSSTARRS